MVKTRCEEVVVQLIVRSYDEQGRPVREQISQPVKVFRAASADFWAQVDQQVASMDAPQPDQPKGKRR